MKTLIAKGKWIILAFVLGGLVASAGWFFLGPKTAPINEPTFTAPAGQSQQTTTMPILAEKTSTSTTTHTTAAKAEEKPAQQSAPTQTETASQPAAAPVIEPMASHPTAPAGQQSVPYVSLNYDETNGDPLTTGQMQLIARYLRIAPPISQASLEAAISQIQQEAVATHATTLEGPILKLNQRHAWLVWCSDARKVDPPSDVSVVHEETLLAPETHGRVWIQIPFADGVPPRVDDTWKGCTETGFWAVAVH